MKTSYVKLISLIFLFVIFITNTGFSQTPCLECNGNTASGVNATAVGLGNVASGDYSFSAGYNNESSGYSSISMGRLSESPGAYSVALGSQNFANNLSFAFGQYARANAEQSLAIGRYVEANATGSIALGSSVSGLALENNISNSLMIGFNSTSPTLFVGPTEIGSSFGKVGIGTSSPRSELEVNGGLTCKGFAMPNGSMEDGYVLTSNAEGIADWAPLPEALWEEYGHSGNIFRVAGFVGIGTAQPTARLQLGDRWAFNDLSEGYKTIAYNATYAYERFYHLVNGPASMISFDPSGGIGFQTATSGLQGEPVGDFTNAMYVDNTGRVGINTMHPGENSKLDVNGKLKTNEFQLLNNAGNGFVLQCDEQGVASWIDPVSIDDGDWVVSGNNVYTLLPIRVGIGTESPMESLHLGDNMRIDGNIKGGRDNWNGFKIFAGTGTEDGAHMSLASNYDNTGSIKLYAKGSSGRVEFHTEAGQVMSVRANSEVVIGDPNTAATLKVNGDIESNHVRVSVDAWWDCVFEEDYELQSLEELQQFVRKNKHLPGMPSEQEVMEDGLDVASMNALLLKKLEELTLYIFELKKENDKIKSMLYEQTQNYEKP